MFIQFPIGIITGWIFGNFIGGEKAGERGRIHWEWFLNTTKIHLHHWIIMSLILVIVIIYAEHCHILDTRGIDLLIGFLIGGILQGLSYSDRFKIIQA